jgi:hypothetical protein
MELVMKILRQLVLAIVGLAGLALFTPAKAADIDCEMRFSMSGWSAFYKTASGSGTIKCNNGKSMTVKVRAKGGGITFGKSTIENGIGEFSGVRSIDEVLGTYVAGEAHAGAAKSAGAQVMTKGDVNLALSGKGRGWDVGIAFGKFIISRR